MDFNTAKLNFLPINASPVKLTGGKTCSFCGEKSPVNDVFVKGNTDNAVSSAEASEIQKTSEVVGVPYADREKFAKYFEKKIEEQLGDYSAKDIETMTENVSTATGVSKEEAAEVISRMNAFSGWSQLDAMEKSINKLDVNGIFDSYHDSKSSALGLTKESVRNKKHRFGKFSINDVMTYLSLKKHLIDFNDEASGRILFVDDAEISRLKEIKEKNKLLFADITQQTERGNLKLAFFDGWNAKANGKNVAQSLFGSPITPEESAVAVINRMKKENITLDEALNGDMIKELQDLFGKNVKVNIMKNESVPGQSPDDIKTKMSTKHPSAIEILASENAILDEMLPADYDKDGAAEIFNKYLDSMLLCHSSKSVNEYMKNLHSQIVETVESSGKTEDDILYVIPSQGKSFELLSYQYAKANDIEPSKFIYYNAFDMREYDVAEKSVNNDITGKTLVLIDDIVGSGNSMLNQEFRYGSFSQVAKSSKQPTNIIFCPLIAMQKGLDKIQDYVDCESRRGRKLPDKVIVGKTSNYEEFLKSITNKEMYMLEKLLGDYGYDEAYFCSAMPYMLPDNNSPAAALMLLPFLKNPLANKNRDYAEALSEAVAKRVAQYSKTSE